MGTSGSGKTTLAKQLSRDFGLQHIELDAINWLPNWIQRDPDEFTKIVSERVMEEGWVMEGNYSRTRGMVWSRATTVIWLNMPFHVVFFRMFIRIFKRALKKEVLWNGNRESLGKHFYSKDSMLYWVMKTHLRRKREYRALFNDARYAHLEKIELKGQKQVDRFVLELTAARKADGRVLRADLE